MMQTRALFILLLLSVPSSALYDSYASIDSKGAQMCLSADGFTAKSCNQTQMLVLDGTRDHIIYILPYSTAPANESMNAGMRYYAGEMMNASVAVLGFVVMAFIALAGILLYQELILKRPKHGY